MDIATAKSIIADVANTRSVATAAVEGARKSVDDAKRATARLAESIRNVDDEIAKASSFDKQWEEFKSKFDQLNKLAAQRLSGMMGVSTGASKRPAEMIS